MKPSLIHRPLRLLLLLAVAVTAFSCRPRGILSSRQMRDVIVDLHKTDALLAYKHYSNYDYEARTAYYSQVLAAHEVTQAQFDSSLVWYTAHPAFFDKIYPRVLNELKAEEEAFLAIHPEFASPQEQTAAIALPESRPFTRTELDSLLWVTTNGPSHSWHEWQRPFSLRIND